MKKCLIWLGVVGEIMGNNFSARLNQFIESSAGDLSDEQRDAVRLIANVPVSILTGAPGTGKTATVKALLDVFEQAGYKVRLAAPTGGRLSGCEK